MKHHCTIAALACLALAGPALALPSNVDSVSKFSWSENCGWMNWRDADSAAQGVRILPAHLQGWVWAENIGWINTGNGNAPYANTNNTNFGINVSPAGELSGFAWSENAGWINFSGGALAVPANPAMVDWTAERLRGLAWSESIGWINLDDATHFVQFTPACPGDVDGDGMVGLSDIAVLINNWTLTVPPAPLNADQDADGSVGIGDLAVVIQNWALICP